MFSTFQHWLNQRELRRQARQMNAATTMLEDACDGLSVPEIMSVTRFVYRNRRSEVSGDLLRDHGHNIAQIGDMVDREKTDVERAVEQGRSDNLTPARQLPSSLDIAGFGK